MFRITCFGRPFLTYRALFYYLQDEELARQLVELGYRGSGEVTWENTTNFWEHCIDFTCTYVLVSKIQ